MHLDFLTLAGTKYCDYCGTFAADEKDVSNSIEEIIKANGFNYDEYFPFSIKLTLMEPGLVRERSYYLTILAVERAQIGNSYQNIVDFVEEDRMKSLPVHKFYFKVEIDVFFNLFKRAEIDFGLFTKSAFDYGEQINISIQDEVSLDK